MWYCYGHTVSEMSESQPPLLFRSFFLSPFLPLTLKASNALTVLLVLRSIMDGVDDLPSSDPHYYLLPSSIKIYRNRYIYFNLSRAVVSLQAFHIMNDSRIDIIAETAPINKYGGKNGVSLSGSGKWAPGTGQ